MKKVKIEQSAKINLTLDVLGVTGGYHDIESLVTSIDLLDKIVVKARKDKKVTLKTLGIPTRCAVTENNAYKTARAFIKEFSTNGVDITIKKRIPVGAGLGGSSADVAGVLIAMEKLYKTGGDLSKIATEMGSDCNYMLKGGFAVISGRGEKVKEIDFGKKLYFLIVDNKDLISARKSYNKYDELGKTYPPCTKKAVGALISGDFDAFERVIKNDLYDASSTFSKAISGSVYALKEAGAKNALMTGSGSATFAVFSSARERNKVYNALKKIFKERLIKAKSI